MFGKITKRELSIMRSSVIKWLDSRLHKGEIDKEFYDERMKEIESFYKETYKSL